MANVKMPGLKKDSNPYRQRQNEKELEEFLAIRPETNLYDVPEGYFLRDEKLYKHFIDKLKQTGVVHLIDLDVSILVSTVNTLSLLNETEKAILQDGIQQEVVTREGHTKFVPNPLIATRNTLTNVLDRQLKSLMLDPSTRQQLLESLNEIDYMETNEESDAELIAQILGKD